MTLLRAAAHELAEAAAELLLEFPDGAPEINTWNRVASRARLREAITAMRQHPS